MMTRSQYSQALAVLERLANANESQAELLRAIQDDLTELRAVKRSAWPAEIKTHGMGVYSPDGG